MLTSKDIDALERRWENDGILHPNAARRIFAALREAREEVARLKASQRDVVRRAADLVKFAVYSQWSKGEKTAWSDLSDAIDRGFDKLAQGEGERLPDPIGYDLDTGENVPLSELAQGEGGTPPPQGRRDR